MSANLFARLRRGLMAGAAFVRGNHDRTRRMSDALDAIEDNERRVTALEVALRKLVFMARTSGGWSPDRELMAACDAAEELLGEAALDHARASA